MADTRDTIRAVALGLFLERGYEQTSMSAIAERVGITKASLYYHYPAKQVLLLAIVEPLLRAWHTVVEDAERLEHTPDNVRLVLARSLDATLAHRSAAGIFLRDAVAAVAALAPLWDELVGIGTRLQAWLAGPAPSTGDRIRAIAAAEVMGAAFRAGAAMPDVDEGELRRTLLACCAAVLGLEAG